MKTISIINHKGGVAKTTTTANLGYEFTQNFDKKVLVIDLDPSGNLSSTLRKENSQEPTATIANVLMGGASAKSAITETKYKNLYIIQAGQSLKLVDKEISNVGSVEIMRNALLDIQREFDYCLIDNPPTITEAAKNGLVASDEVLIPICVESYSLLGLGQLIGTIQEARKTNPSLYFLGTLITRYQKIDDEDVKKLEVDIYSQKQFPVIPTKIRTSPKAAGSNVNLKVVAETSKRSSAARDYHKVAKDYLEGRLREV